LSGKNVLLTAGTETILTWQDGSTNSTFTAITGIVLQKVTDSTDARYDSVIISNFIYPCFSLVMTHRFVPAQVMFSAGLFSSYVWQDGSTLPNFWVVLGEYSRTATDSNGCIQKDTVSVISLCRTATHTCG
jgi:hypothetical protein